MQALSISVPGSTYERLGTAEPSTLVHGVAAEPVAFAHTPKGGPRWEPHEQSWLELGGLPWFRCVPRCYYRLRWAAWHPLQRRLLWGRMTIGELLAGAGILSLAAGLMFNAWPGHSRTGDITSYAVLLTFLLASRNSIWTFLLGLPFERALRWHALMAYIAVSLGTAHGVLSWLTGGGHHHHLTAAASADTASAELDHDHDKDHDMGLGEGGGGMALNMTGSGASGMGGLSVAGGSKLWGHGDRLPFSDPMFISGAGLIIAIALLVLTSALPHLRRWNFELWLRLHIVLFLTATSFAAFHGASALLYGAAGWAFDVLLRSAYIAGFRNPKEAQIVALPGGVVRLSWPKGAFQYSGGQYVFICVPAVSIFEWHPFSLSSHPQHDQVHLHARVLGNWTRALHALALSKQGQGVGSTVKVLIEGPYGVPKVDLHSAAYTHFLLVSGGIGVTPMQSIFNDLLGQKRRGRDVKRLWFVWSVRDKHMLSNVLQYDHKFAHQALPSQLPTSFSPDLITPNANQAPWADELRPERASDDLDCINTEFHLTGVPDHSRFDASNIRPELQPCLHFGRPDLEATITRMRQLVAMSGDRRAAVCVCGPPQMVRDVERLAAKYSGAGVQLDVHAEVFDL